ncbi:hypothetical protein MTR67_002634 [Solanum verrucosum]|uniref:Reverse transcriptase RNase H-like domain-containing protein n=1 Tax=Solanum verrucosum TaxID=315347 RepID=A0AAF0T8Z3_SOLVR|nr:hypothetical protein MTR67_002634 [Solanum verrucosum]
MLTIALVLPLPEVSDGYVVYCNESKVALGCALMQQGKIKRHYLYSVHVDVFTNHKRLQLYMGSVAHVEEEKQELARDVHRLALLGVCLMDTEYGGVIV